jgi:hypothetical protein
MLAPDWKRSSWCSSASCVEVAMVDEKVAMRDSKDLSIPALLYAPEVWQRFVSRAKAGEFDQYGLEG